MNDKVNITIDGKTLSVPSDYTVYKAASSVGIKIPTLCYLKDVNEIGACRMCLVEIEGARNLQASCVQPVSEGMVIQTNSESVRSARKSVLELLMSDHTTDCLVCEKSGECKLQDYCYEYDVTGDEIKGSRIDYKVDTSSPFYTSNQNKCIMCKRCVSVCASAQCSNAITESQRGFKTHIAVPNEGELGNSDCVACGNCVSVCPTGALLPKNKEKHRHWETKDVRTICPYCGVGCEMNLAVKGNKVVGVKPSNGPANEGLLCVKGKFGHQFINHPDRLTKPLIKKDGKFVESTWDEAYSLIKSKADDVKKRKGADAFGGFASARVTNEENYLFQKMMRAVIGTNNVDHCARLCHASTVAGLATTYGSGAMTNSIKEVEGVDVFLVSGSNTTETHPVIGSKIKRAKQLGAKLIVAEPRRIELAEHADIFLQITPGTNVALCNGLMNVILTEGLENREFIKERTENFEELEALIKEYTPERVAEICGIDADELRKAARMYADSKNSAIYYSMGVTQHSTGTQGVMSFSNLALLCGHIGKESSGVNPLRGQNNVQGACDLGALPGDLTGYQKIANPDVIAKFEKAWGAKLSTNAGLTITEMINSAEKGDIEFLYIMGENPMISDPDITHVKEALEKTNFLVVQDIFLTETAELADVVLPAVTFAEKDGTFTNTERRVQRLRKAINPIGMAKPDWKILMEVMSVLGYDKKYNDASEIFDEISEVTPSYGGMSYKRLDLKGLQWPCLDEKHPGTKFLHSGKFTRGKGLFKPADYVKANELPDAEYPTILTTGRILYHFHTLSMTGRVDSIMEVEPSSYVEIHPLDAQKKGIKDGEIVKVTSRRGSVDSKARVTDVVEEGVVFMPFHFADGPANVLTNSVIDPTAKIPELKVCAVRVEKK